MPCSPTSGILWLDFAGLLKSISVDSDQNETPFLIETERIQIIVSSNQPEACTVRLQCCVFDSMKQKDPNSLARSQAIDTHDFACLPFAMIRHYPNTFTLIFRDKTR